jgi:glycosidase
MSLRVWLLAIAGALCAHHGLAAGPDACKPAPLEGRSLYLRGSFNSWTASENQKFTWACNRYQLVTRLEGEHRFKVGDEGWSADADFGASDHTGTLMARGKELTHKFNGSHRLTLTMDTSKDHPNLTIESCPTAAPFGETVLYLRGSMNNWAALDDFAFQYSCDAYYLNLQLTGTHEFRLADAAGKEDTSFGPFTFDFAGEHTLRLLFIAGKPQLSLSAKTFADPKAQPVTDPVAASMQFDSRNAIDKQPFGAVTAGSTVQFGVSAKPGINKLTLVIEKRLLQGNQEVLEYHEVARVPMTRSPQADVDRWQAQHTFNDVSVYGYWFEAEINGHLFVYQNNSDSVFWTREKGSGGRGAVLVKPTHTGSIRRFRQTVYASNFQVPEWAADAVYYYIFPDRFRNGNHSNDPKPGLDKYHDTTVELHSNWLEKPYKPGSGDGSDNVYNNDFFGGDLAGIIDKLDYIRDLGANTLYLTPIFKASSNHKYDTADYKNIDPAFGSNDDFVRLTKAAAQRGIRVITDTSLNHTGSDSLYFDRFGNFKSNGAFAGGRIRPDSPYADWYTFDAKQMVPDKQYKGWVGVSELPELDKASQGFRQFAYGAPDSVMKLWLDRGAAGWRMDVAPWVPDDFWREWRSAIKQHKPDALTVAETWFDASKYFLGDMFDSTMNYIFRSTVLEYAAGGKASQLYQNIELMRESYSPQAFYALMNLLSSHDQARSLHVLGWNSDQADAKTVQLAKQRFRLALFFQMTFPGAPAIYYGDEVGVTGGDDPYNRATYPWADLGGKPDLALLVDVKKLTRLRHDHAVLRRGSIEAPLLVDDHVIVLLRQLGERVAITAVNNATSPTTVEVTLPAQLGKLAFVDALSGQRIETVNSKLQLTVPAQFGSVYLGAVKLP